MKRPKKPTEPTALVTTANPVGSEVARIVEELPRGLYRSHLTICKVELDPKTGLEKGSIIVTQWCTDFEIRPPALEPPPAPTKDGGL